MKRVSTGAVILAVVFTIILTGCSTESSSSLEPSSPKATEEILSLQIESPEDGAKLGTNLLKVSGTVSNSGATVLINGRKAKVEKDGSFSAYIELSEGKNTVETVGILADKKATQAVTVTFDAPLVLFYLDRPQLEQDVDYTETPLKISGSVSNPGAKVTLDGTQVQVEKDGSFSASIQLSEGYNNVEVAAVLGKERDVMRYIITVTSEGKLIWPPPTGVLSKLEGFGDVTLKAGEAVSRDITLQVRKDVRGRTRFHHRISRVSEKYGHNELPIPEGLEVSVEPSGFMVYPMTVYHLTMTVKAAPGTAPAEYFFKLETYHGDAKWMAGWIKVNVQS